MANYTKNEAAHWEIKTTIDKTIQLQLDKSHGFGIEYHRRCFYDKLFIFDSTKRQKYARICGPKPNQEKISLYYSLRNMASAIYFQFYLCLN